MLDAGEAIRGVETDQKVIALTFDDGPDPTTTPLVLDLLARYHAHATFFVIGSEAERNPDLLRAIVATGHEIGSHSFSHRRVTRMSQATLAEELKLTAAVIDDACGVKPIYFRPPDYALSPAAGKTLSDHGYAIVLWDNDARDWERPGADRIAARVVENARPGGIVLMHDGGGDRTQTVAALEITLQNLSGQGYRFLTLSELLRVGSGRR